MSIEEISGGYSAVYGILKALEERGLVSRGYFVEGLTATQFAAKGAESQLRDHRNPPSVLGVSVLSSTDPANLYGSVIAWPQDLKVRAERAPGARVILENGVLVGFLSRSERHLGTCSFDAVDPELSRMMSLVAGLALILKSSSSASLLLESIDGQPARESRMADALCHAGFRRTAKGLLLRREVG
jgi:ATP-dependent Lhr-like helicase